MSRPRGFADFHSLKAFSQTAVFLSFVSLLPGDFKNLELSRGFTNYHVVLRFFGKTRVLSRLNLAVLGKKLTDTLDSGN